MKAVMNKRIIKGIKIKTPNEIIWVNTDTILSLNEDGNSEKYSLVWFCTKILNGATA
jgi:hypothetical protein